MDREGVKEGKIDSEKLLKMAVLTKEDELALSRLGVLFSHYIFRWLFRMQDFISDC